MSRSGMSIAWIHKYKKLRMTVSYEMEDQEFYGKDLTCIKNYLHEIKRMCDQSGTCNGSAVCHAEDLMTCPILPVIKESLSLPLNDDNMSKGRYVSTEKFLIAHEDDKLLKPSLWKWTSKLRMLNNTS